SDNGLMRQTSSLSSTQTGSINDPFITHGSKPHTQSVGHSLVRSSNIKKRALLRVHRIEHHS
ncbi:MAG: hypothetical protein P8P99_11740, partial [Maricaulis sp.]|nr:hypothetical protein [Maricaulis sp.]